jgi:hypothetical protein
MFQGGRRLLALPGRQGTCYLLAKAQISKDGARKGDARTHREPTAIAVAWVVEAEWWDIA